MRKMLAAFSAAAFLILGGASAGAAPARTEAVSAVSESDPRGCPAVAVVAARGSEESVAPGPTSYSTESRWVSNGYEGYQIHSFLRYAEERHLAQHGEPLLGEVPVLALAPAVYPAALPLPVIAEEGEELAALEVAVRVNALLNRVSALEIAQEALRDLAGSLYSGITGTAAHLAEWEEATGCAPDYILVGYSQGAVVLTAQEQSLAEQGRLVGALYLGNPWVVPDEPTLVGGADPGGGMLQRVPRQWQRPAEGVPRLNYCLPGDLACDASLASGLSAAEDAAQTGGLGAHTDYFTGEAPREHDDQVADMFAAWIRAAERR